MLRELTIENVAVIERASVRFNSGFHVLTGETGAGKSIVIDSINAVLGERTGRDVVRDGATTARVSAYFDALSPAAKDVLRSFDLDADDEVLITRTISADGKSSCKIGGKTVTVSMLRQLGRELITICGQHDSQHLLQKEKHLDYIDTLAGSDALKAQYADTYRALRDVKKQLHRLRKADADKGAKLDFLSFQIKELEDAHITPGETEALHAQKKKLQNKEKRLQSLQTVCAVIDGGDSGGMLQNLYTLSSALAQLSDSDDSFRAFEETLSGLRYELEDCAAAARRTLDEEAADDTDIDTIEQRLDQLYRLGQKYGRTEEDMLQTLQKAKDDYDSIAFSEQKILSLEQQEDALSDELLRVGDLLTDCRKQAAAAFEQQVTQELTALDMPGARFRVEFREQNATENGFDDVEFCFSANPGQGMKGLAKIASGGELSRIMLAIRCVLSQAGVETMIFDEIDTGVSGRAASRIAERLRRISNGRQVLCVTHLAQIAAAADRHLLVEKTLENGETRTRVTLLDPSGREAEIARLIGGELVSDATLASARALLAYYG